MTKRRNLAGMAIAASAAALFITAGCASNDSAGTSPSASSSTMAKVACEGVNACKGLSDCKTASNACAGQNDCKGLGIVNLTAEQCKKIGGHAA